MPHSLYFGEVVHIRHRPKHHSLRYNVFCALINLAEVKDNSEFGPLFAFNKWGIFSFWEKDFGTKDDRNSESLFENIANLVRTNGHMEKIKRIELLCYPRVFGFIFNPLSVYFGYNQKEEICFIVYEVANTFGERHHYIIDTSNEKGAIVRHKCPKVFYVSPFIPMECEYNFNITPPSSSISIKIKEADKDGDLLFAAFYGKYREFNAKNLFKAIFAYPLMTLKVVGAIHLEAIKLLLKGAPVFKHHEAIKPISPSIIRPEIK